MSSLHTTIDGFRGVSILPQDAEYDRARQLWNAMHDRRPALIARCLDTDDVVSALRHARIRELSIAVRCGGHSFSGQSACDEGIVIDLRPMNAVKVDPVARRVRAQGGCLLSEVDHATQKHGLVVPLGAVSHTGLAGLTLGGGVGRMMRRHGLTIDSLISAELVTAEGCVVRANAEQHSDLFWAIRGGGGNFGIVTEFEFAPHELAEPLAVLCLFHRLDSAHSQLVRSRELMSDAPDQLICSSFFRKAPPFPWIPPEVVGEPGVLTVIEWSGEPSEGERLLSGFMSKTDADAQMRASLPYVVLQSIDDAEFSAGNLAYIKSGFLDEVTDDVLEILFRRTEEVGSPVSMIELHPMRGAISRISHDATAFPHRGAGWLFNALAIWDSPRDTATEIAWTKDTFTALQPHSTGGVYVNFLDFDEADGCPAAYGGTLKRLQRAKAVYDPDNNFALNNNIRPENAL